MRLMSIDKALGYFALKPAFMLKDGRTKKLHDGSLAVFIEVGWLVVSSYRTYQGVNRYFHK